MSTNTSTIVFAVVVGCLLGLGSVASAGILGPNYGTIPISDGDPEEEAEFPDPVVLEDHDLNRSDGSEGGIPSGVSFLTIDVEGYKAEHAQIPDDASLPFQEEELDDTEYGLRFDMEGYNPVGLTLPDEPVVLAYPHDSLRTDWRDHETYDKSLDITVTATWVDEYGREGPTSDPIDITHEGLGSSIPGCASTASGSPTTAVALVALLLVVMATALPCRRPGRREYGS